MDFTESASTPLDVCSVKVEPFFFVLLWVIKEIVSSQICRNGLHASFCLSASVWRAAEHLQFPPGENYRGMLQLHVQQIMFRVCCVLNLGRKLCRREKKKKNRKISEA